MSVNARCLSFTRLFSYQQGLNVLLEAIVVKALEGLSVVELGLVRIAGSCVLAEDVEPQLIGPPVTVLGVVSACCISSCRPDTSNTFVPPDAVLATRIGHLAGSSPMLPIVM